MTSTRTRKAAPCKGGSSQEILMMISILVARSAGRFKPGAHHVWFE